MEHLFTKYPTVKGKNELEQFTQFYESEDLVPIHNWVEATLAKKQGKSNEKSDEMRKRGNEFYQKKKLQTSLQYYEKSLQYAVYNSAEYGMALANRSAVLFALEKYLDCLSDIKLCLDSNYPQEMRHKLYLRKIECYYKLKMYDKCQEFLDTIIITKNSELSNKLKNLKESRESNFEYNKCTISVPDVDNQEFLCASDKIKLEYNDTNGRHVVAKEDVNVGDVLFVEKAFMFAPVFEEHGGLVRNKCYNCLKDCSCCIPCKSCTICMYCTEECRNMSWESGHRFECEGMILWYHLGIALPAFRCVLKGMPSRFKQLNEPCSQHSEKFGDAVDNYPYFNSLITNIAKMKNITPLLVISSAVILYLKNKTDFFEWIIFQPNVEFQDMNAIHFIGGILVKHIAQLSSNSSVIQHPVTLCDLDENSLLPVRFKNSKSVLNYYESKAVASGIFPAVSIMNHSCNSNVSMYFIKDTIIVKAVEPIRKGEEIFNCYAVDYKSMNRAKRQMMLQTLYFFKCDCRICNNPENEYDVKFNYYICTKCKSKMACKGNQLICTSCNSEENVKTYKEIEQTILDIFDSSNDIDDLEECKDKMEQIFNNHHDYYFEYYIKLAKLYLRKGYVTKYKEFKEKILQVVKDTEGEFSKKYALTMLTLHDFEQTFKYIHDDNIDDVLKLYYPIEEIQITSDF